jgi:outer membrane lipoprotein-sorting protein
MKKIILGLYLSLIFVQAFAVDDPKSLIRQLNKKFAMVNDYTANVDMKFDVPGVRMSNMKGKVFFKKPNKFRVRTKGIFFMPRQNPMQNIANMLQDTSAYTSIISGYETFDDKYCAIVNIIPLKQDGELILGKFWIDTKEILVIKSQVTTKNNGTIETQNIYGDKKSMALPDQIVLRIDMKKMKMPKIMAVDLNKKSKGKVQDDKKESGAITMIFTNYRINTKLEDAVFTESE